MKAKFLHHGGPLGWLLTEFPLCAIVISKAHHHPDIGTTNAHGPPHGRAQSTITSIACAPFSGEDDRVLPLTLSTSRRGEKFNAGMGRRCGVADFLDKPSDVYGAVS